MMKVAIVYYREVQDENQARELGKKWKADIVLHAEDVYYEGLFIYENPEGR